MTISAISKNKNKSQNEVEDEDDGSLIAYNNN